MIDWAARARALFAPSLGGGNDKTDETRVMSVSSYQDSDISDQRAGISSVSSVGMTAGSANDICIVGAEVPAPRGSANPYMTPEQGDECHAGGWDDAEIDAFKAREARFTCMGRAADAEHLAERLTLRDRQYDDRRLCLECTWLVDTGRCLAAATGRIPGADRRLEPVQTILQRCGAFGLRKGLV